MVCLRHFTDSDADIIRANQYPNMSKEEILNTIHESNSCLFQGRYYELFAVLSKETIVGSASLFHKSQSVASIGIEIYEQYRRSGFAAETMLLLLDHARQLGYRIIQNQVRTDNTASIRLHEKLAFESDRYVYKNKKDHSVLLFLKVL